MQLCYGVALQMTGNNKLADQQVYGNFMFFAGVVPRKAYH